MAVRVALTALIVMISNALGTAWPAGEADFARYEGAAAAPDHGALARFLDRYRSLGENGVARVDYAAVTGNDHAALKAYIAGLAALDPTALTRDDAFAYWANLYNAVTLDVVLDAYPVTSIRDIRSSPFRAGPWKKPLVEVNGKSLSLDDIEHGIMRAHWDEPRVHYAVNCASIGCPNLPESPFTGETLDAALDAAARDYVNSERGVAVGADGKVTASSIYRWYQDDFGNSEKSVLAHARLYAEPALTSALAGKSKIDRYGYDWTLNDVLR